MYTIITVMVPRLMTHTGMCTHTPVVLIGSNKEDAVVEILLGMKETRGSKYYQVYNQSWCDHNSCNNGVCTHVGAMA